MSGLLALLDDVAPIAKVAATSVDDIAAAAGKAGTKTAGVIIDDAAVTPKYVHGFAPARELPIIWRIARGSIFNKIVLLLPVAMLLANFAPWLITPLLMLGGGYLSFEGAEKIFHALFPHAEPEIEKDMSVRDPGRLEEQKVKGAIKTDFILSAEIMTIALAAIPQSTLWMEAATLAVVAVGITVAVYGSVALIVKMDDLGLLMSRKGRLGLTRALGRGIVKNMGGFLAVLMTVGTAAMLWVGGSIVLHGAHELGWHAPYETVHHLVEAAFDGISGPYLGALKWANEALFFAIFGLVFGALLIPLATRVIGPVWQAVFKGRA